jgi:S1-C subfamily serine protease
MKIIKRLANTLILLVVGIILIQTGHSSTVHQQPAEIVNNTTEVLFNSQQKNSRNSAVKVQGLLGGHGSGTYAELNGHKIVITAKHVIDYNEIHYVTTASGEKVLGQVIWQSKNKDIAILKVPELMSRIPVQIQKTEYLDVGQSVLYTGYPASYEMLTSRATVSGHANEHNATLLQGFVWFGYSGSGVFDISGKLRAIVVAIGVESFHGKPQPLESVVYIFEINKADILEMKKSLEI